MEANRGLGAGLDEIQGARNRGRGRRRTFATAWLEPASYAALAGGLLAPGLRFGPTFDAAAFVLVGSGIRGGRMPYRDFWDDKPPGLYLLNGAAQAVFPWLDRWLVCWLLTLAFTVAAAVIIESLLRPRVGPAVAWAAALAGTFFIACYPVVLGGGYGESFAIPFVLAAVLVMDRSGRRPRDTALTGLLLSVACLLSLQSAPAAVAIGLATSIGGGFRATTARAVAMALGGLALPALAAGWLIWGGAGAQAYDLLIRYNVDFYRLNGQSQFWPRLLIGFYFLAALWPSVAAQLYWWLRGPERPDRLAWACLAWGLASLGTFVYEQRIFMHYLILVAPAAVVIGAPAFRRLWDRLRHPRAVPRRIAIAAEGAAVVLLLTTLALGAEWPGTGLAITFAWHNDEMAVSSWLRQNTSPSQTLFVWGDHPEIYLDSDRAPACRYIYLDPMTTQHYWSPEATAALLESWKADPPGAIVETPTAVPLFRTAASGADDPRTYDTLDPLRQFVRANYGLARSVGEADIWVRVQALGARRDPGPPAGGRPADAVDETRSLRSRAAAARRPGPERVA